MKPSCKGSSESQRMDFARLLYTIIFPKAFRQELILYVRSFLTLSEWVVILGTHDFLMCLRLPEPLYVREDLKPYIFQ